MILQDVILYEINGKEELLLLNKDKTQNLKFKLKKSSNERAKTPNQSKSLEFNFTRT